MLHRSNTDRKWCGNSGTKPATTPTRTTRTPATTPGRTSGGTSGTTSKVITDYLTSMRRRAALLARTGQKGTIYLAVTPSLVTRPNWPASLEVLRRRLRPAEVHTFTDRWPGADSSALYTSQWEDYADGLTGLVVVVGRGGMVGPGITREIESARLRNLPIMVQSPSRQVPLIDCREIPLTHPTRWLVKRIEVPAPGRKPSDTLTATLAAMGAGGAG